MKEGMCRREVQEGLLILIKQNKEKIEGDPWIRIRFGIRPRDGTPAETILLVDLRGLADNERLFSYWVDENLVGPVWQLMRFAIQQDPDRADLTIALWEGKFGEVNPGAVRFKSKQFASGEVLLEFSAYRMPPV